LDKVRGTRLYFLITTALCEKCIKLTTAQGDEIGSSMIDIAFHKFAESRLKHIRARLRRSPDDVAWDMTRENFQIHKEEFGTENSNYQRDKTIVVPGLPEDFESEIASIKRGKMTITK
jgi:hypothetical protein